MIFLRRQGRQPTRGGIWMWRALVLVAVLLRPASAQETAADGAGRPHQASRAELEALAITAEQFASSTQGSSDLREQKRAEAEALRARLRDGDFRNGDRIVLYVRGDSALTDTFTVRPGRTLRLPNLPDVALHGVLRGELQGHLAAHIARFVRDPVVESESLIRLGLLGQVARPGYYFVTTDGLVTDAIMAAGGPTQDADLTKATVRRGTTELWNREQLRAAVIDGVTVDQLGLRSGDEIMIGQRRSRWESVLRTAGYLSGIVLGIYGATQVAR